MQDRTPLTPTDDAAEVAATMAGTRRREERRSEKRFHLPERRTGFDRRRRYPFTGALRDDARLLLGVLVAINVLSALDFALTYLQLQAGTIVEGNLLLAGLFAQGPFQAWLFKTVVMLGVTLLMWRSRQHRSVLLLAIVTLAGYFALIIYHLLGMTATGLL